MSKAMTPSPSPNQSVQRRISKVAVPPNVADVVTSKRVKPNILPSAVPNPPGRPEAEPTSDETAKMKVDLINKSRLGAIPKPVKTKYMAPHSPDQEIKPIEMASSSSRNCRKV